MFEVTVDSFEMNIFHRGCLSVGYVRHGYTSRVKDFFSRAKKKCLALGLQRWTGLCGLCLVRSQVESGQHAKKD